MLFIDCNVSINALVDSPYYCNSFLFNVFICSCTQFGCVQFMFPFKGPHAYLGNPLLFPKVYSKQGCINLLIMSFSYYLK